MKFNIAAGLLVSFIAGSSASAATIVTPETVEAQKKATRTLVLDSGVNVILRRIPDSGISSISVGFGVGSANQPPGRKVLNDWTMSSMARAAKGYPKKETQRFDRTIFNWNRLRWWSRVFPMLDDHAYELLGAGICRLCRSGQSSDF